MLNNQKGSVIVIVTVMLVVLLGFVALTVDVGFAYSMKSQFQTAADAGALAGAQDMSTNPSGAAAVARTYAKNNVKGLTDDDIIVTVHNKQITVYISKEIPTFFARFISPEHDSFNISATSTAALLSFWDNYPFIVSYSNANNAIEFKQNTKFIPNGNNLLVHSNGNLEIKNNTHVTGPGTVSASSVGTVSGSTGVFANVENGAKPLVPPLMMTQFEDFYNSYTGSKYKHTGKFEIKNETQDWSTYDLVYITGKLEIEGNSNVKGNLIIVKDKVETKNSGKLELEGVLYCISNSNDRGIELKGVSELTVKGSILCNQKIEFKEDAIISKKDFDYSKVPILQNQLKLVQ